MEIFKNVFLILLLLHFSGAELYKHYAEWKYKNENNFINSLLFANSASYSQAIVWEYYLYKDLKSTKEERQLNETTSKN